MDRDQGGSTLARLTTVAFDTVFFFDEFAIQQRPGKSISVRWPKDWGLSRRQTPGVVKDPIDAVLGDDDEGDDSGGLHGNVMNSSLLKARTLIYDMPRAVKGRLPVFRTGSYKETP